jgi:hypothetical protein
MIQAKPLTETTWMMRDTRLEKSLGMVNKREDKYHLLGVKETFDSLEAIAQHFGGELVDVEDEETTETVSDIKGFPIKHKGALEFETKDVNGVTIETYKTKAGSKKVFAAGWYGLKFKNGLVPSYCPKFQTLLDNTFIGPYTNELDLKFHGKKFNLGELLEVNNKQGVDSHDEPTQETGT